MPPFVKESCRSQLYSDDDDPQSLNVYMRTIVLVCLFAVAATAAVLPEASYLPPAEKLSSEYLPPSEELAEVKEALEETLDSAALADDGYRYKTIRKLKYRVRRDVSELVAPEYLPPAEEVAEVKEAVETTEAPEESAVLADDGYRYKTIRKLKYRVRRDVSELVAPEYLPPAEEVAEVKEAVETTEAPEESAVLADDGYRYKTIRKLKYRVRRDVSELVAPEYLPPAEEVAEVKEAIETTEAPVDTAVLADDGYRYKTIRKLKYRQRRDVSELVAPEYLPPSEEIAVKEAVETTEAPEESAVLADDGYRYKTIRKLKYRHRRDVSELVAPEYLPPAEEVAEVKEAIETTEAPEESAVLADDGYRYKTIRKLKYRVRRDVSELVAPEYLPPAEDVAEVKEAIEATETPEDSAVLADDGYRYKTIRKLKYRQRRDVSELVAPEYLPPAEEVAEVKEAIETTEAPEESAVLADDGYRYKTIRKLKYRQRRDVSELVAPEYLPPAEDVAEVKEAIEATETPEDSAVLADDGYRYKTIRKLKYRQRRDVSELVAPEYLPPAEEVAEVKEAIETTEAPEESGVLADDGYRYKTIRKLKYRVRRDVSELVAPEYLPPAEEVAEVKEAIETTEAPEESGVLADDGYRYKTIRKLKYRQRRDVSELVAPEYLPPAEEVAEVKEAIETTEAPEESAVLADDGYRYKTIRKLKYRQRRDVSELVAPEYLPPTEEVAEVKEAIETTEAPENSAVLADDGYRYKTVRKLKYRQRRDVSELVAPEYLPPAEEVAEIKEAIETNEAPEESAVLADDGNRYKTIRKLKYRQRRDVSELVAPEYLPPTEEVAEVEEAVETTEAPEESAVLADDGYRYKTIRKLKYRQRRDVSVIANEYLPPVEEVSSEYIPPSEVKEASEGPEESAALADDGYRYKTIRKLKYRQRRDVSEIIAPEYLPPVEKSASEYLPPCEEVAEVTEIPAEQSAVLADDGYRYKTVKRIRYRQ
ncbi:uncharacterized protein LOC129909416 [Episyrphus balteatus]|uniref:uncharacterized protein LOC129909416 n=1 Tax=Episyrphus balteatus TaxID=286459 RepID=UPI002485A9DB|nr:uncharacterized protein LOC129909416 [Episyrphus balteatus]